MMTTIYNFSVTSSQNTSLYEKYYDPMEEDLELEAKMAQKRQTIIGYISGTGVLLGLVVVTNIFLICLIILRKKMANRVINIILVNLAVGNCLKMLFLFMTTLIEYQWRPGAHVCRLIQIMFYLSMSVQHYTLIVANIDRLLLSICQNFRAQFEASNYYKVLVIAIPWAISMLISIPMQLSWGRKEMLFDRAHCFFILKLSSYKLLLSVIFTLPYIVFVVSSVVCICLFFRRLHIGKHIRGYPNDESEEGIPNALIAITLVNLTHFVLGVPQITLIHQLVYGLNIDYNLIHTHWLVYINLLFSPFLWAIHKDVRERYKTVCCFLIARKYSRFEPDNTVTFTSPEDTVRISNSFG